MRELEALQQENAALRAQLHALVEQVARLNERVAELLAVARRRTRTPSVAAAPACPPALGDDARRAFEQRPAAPALPQKPPRETRASKPSGRKPLPAHLEVEAHRLQPDRCAHCGGTALDVVDEVVEEKLHVVREHQRRRVVTRATCRCRTCLGRTTPPSLPAPYARAKVTCDWLAWFVHQKFGLLTPLDRVRRDLAARQIPLAMGTLVTFVARAADLLAPIDGLHWKQLLAGAWMATDGTGLKVLVPGLPAAHDGYVELYRNTACAVFQYAPDKRGDDVVVKLRPFRGTLTADAEHRFNGVFATGRVRESGCNAHGRRTFRDAEATLPLPRGPAGADRQLGHRA